MYGSQVCARLSRRPDARPQSRDVRGETGSDHEKYHSGTPADARMEHSVSAVKKTDLKSDA